MKKIIIMLLLTVFTLSASAQDFKFGYFSYDNALKSMPDYSIAMANIEKLRSQYDAEIQRAEKEFNSKYEDFLEDQATMAVAIRNKRQAELQDLLEKNLKFKDEANRLLTQAENDALAPLKNKLTETVKEIGQERGYAFVLNTDNNACPFVDSTKGDDINIIIIDSLGK